MTRIHFERRKKNKSFSILMSISIILLLLLFVPQMLVNRTNTIIKHKLNDNIADTTYIKLVKAGLSYLETADAFIIFRSKDEKLRNELLQKAGKRFIEACNSDDTTKYDDFCQQWAKIIPQNSLKNCKKCAQN